MKNYKFFWTILLCIFTGVSCEKEVLFTQDDSSLSRVDEVIKEYTNILTQSKTGWVLELETSEGIYQFYNQFNDSNKVTMYTDNFYYPNFMATPKESTYNIRSLQRPTLSFDTYNYISIINDPTDQISGGMDNQGLLTDFEFEFDTYKDGVFYLTGRINRVKAILREATAFEAEMVKEGYLMGSYLYFQGSTQQGNAFFESIEGDKVSFTPNGRSVDFMYQDDSGNIYKASSPIKATMDLGLTLLDTLMIRGNRMTAIEINSQGGYDFVFGQTRIPMQVQAEPIFPFHSLLGAGKPYVEVFSISAMYQADTNGFKEHFKTMDLYGVQGVSLLFNREGYMDMVINYQGYYITYSYAITFNEARNEFTTLDVSTELDATGLAGQAWSLFGIPPYMLGKTFSIQWSASKFGDYSLAEVEEVVDGQPTGHIFYGVPF